MRMPLLSRAVLAGTAILATATAAQASHKSWDDASSIGRDVLIAAALGVPAVQGDWAGDLQAGGSMALAFGVSEGLKHVFPEERPDHSDRQSFPSGHASIAFAAAATLENRYGWQAGLPAFLAASFVGAARVEARKHHWYDVAAGAAIGTGSGFLLTRKRSQNVHLIPWADSGGGGMTLAMRF